MHRYQIVAQILLVLSILNSALAAPAVLSVREVPVERGVVAVRVPAEGVVAVLQKRPFEPEWETSQGPSPSTTSPEQPKPQLPAPPKKPWTRPKTFTPEKLRAAGFIAGAALFTSAVLGLVDINISLRNISSSS
jgi:hypothetical protein